MLYDKENQYIVIAKKIHNKLKINDKKLIIKIKDACANNNFKILVIKNDKEMQKYLDIFFMLLKIYTDLIIIEKLESE